MDRVFLALPVALLIVACSANETLNPVDAGAPGSGGSGGSGTGGGAGAGIVGTPCCPEGKTSKDTGDGCKSPLDSKVMIDFERIEFDTTLRSPTELRFVPGTNRFLVLE